MELVQSRAWLDSSRLCSQAQRSKADEPEGLSCKVNAGEREGDEEINDEQSDGTINRPIGFNKCLGVQSPSGLHRGYQSLEEGTRHPDQYPPTDIHPKEWYEEREWEGQVW